MSKVSVLVERATLLVALVMISEPAYAYIDPGTGAAVTTAILGLLGSIAYTVRKSIYRIKDVFTKKAPQGDASGEKIQ
jgi:hypothetical protein